MNGFKDIEEISAYRVKVAKLLEDLDALHAAGAKAVRRHDEFMKKHHIEPGIGRKTLLGPRVTARDQAVFRRLLDEFQMIEERLTNREKSQSGKALPVNARAVGNRYRI